MKKPIKITLYIIGVIGFLVAAVYFILIETVEPDLPNPKSDVPIEYKIGWWSNQKGLSVQTLETNVIFDQLNLFNSTALVEYRIQGTITNTQKWRPYIRAVHLSERWVSTPENFKIPTATIVLTPIVASKSDESYNGETIKFNIKIQDYLKSGGWGNNQYFVTSQTQESKIELHQRK